MINISTRGQQCIIVTRDAYANRNWFRPLCHDIITVVETPAGVERPGLIYRS